jgi:hypothetical protein
MDTTTNILDTTAAMRVPRRNIVRFGRLVKKAVAAGALATALGIGVSLVPAAPASAATSVGYCFYLTNGQPAAGINTSIAVHMTNGTWQHVATSRTGSTGCDRVDTSRWAYNYVRVYAGTFFDRGVRYEGWTPYYSLPGIGHANLGWGYVTMRWI